MAFPSDSSVGEDSMVCEGPQAVLCVRTRKTQRSNYSNFILSRLSKLSGYSSGQARGSEDSLVSNKSVSLPATSTLGSKFRGLGFPANERPKEARRGLVVHRFRSAIITTPSTHTRRIDSSPYERDPQSPLAGW
mmetsp:Transcript_38162/g.85813  ORF Transcript_38162/g.85813 Transcript_38162/m.85813 type:complete len:134 (-) Transcript_38162:54-455(-)